MTARVVTLWRYPVKGLSAEPVEEIALSPGECFPQDRRFALARASCRFDAKDPKWLPKKNFFTLMREEELALLRTRFDERSGVLTIERDGQILLAEPITEPAGRARIDGFFAAFLKGALHDPPRVVEAPGHAFADAEREPNTSTDHYVSLINLASIGALESVMEGEVDPMRFRANLYFEGAPAWTELDWVGSAITAGGARLRVVAPIVRCAATDVNPATAERDRNIPKTLRQQYGHIHMGVYAEVIGGGALRRGDWLGTP